MTTMPVTRSETVTGNLMPMTRWGYHTYDKDTFLKLRALKKAYWEAVYGLAEWFRWTARTKNRQGEEPVYCTVFGKPTHRDRLRVRIDPTKIESPLRWAKTIPQHLNDFGMLKAYEISRKPQNNLMDPVDLRAAQAALPKEKIDELYSACLAWRDLK